MVVSGIVAGGEIDGAVELAAGDFVGNRRRGGKGIAQLRADAVMIQDVDGQLRKFFGVEARVVADEDGGVFRFAVDVSGDGGDGQANVGKSKIVGDEAAPAGSSKLDRGRVHGRVF